jgi:hypothetical protein
MADAAYAGEFDDLVLGVRSGTVVQDRTELHMSDGSDDGESRDPA